MNLIDKIASLQKDICISSRAQGVSEGKYIEMDECKSQSYTEVSIVLIKWQGIQELISLDAKSVLRSAAASSFSFNAPILSLVIMILLHEAGCLKWLDRQALKAHYTDSARLELNNIEYTSIRRLQQTIHLFQKIDQDLFFYI